MVLSIVSLLYCGLNFVESEFIFILALFWFLSDFFDFSLYMARFIIELGI